MLTYKRKLILTKEQEQRINSWIGTCRVVYNLGLEIRISAYRNKQESVHKYDLMKQVTEIRAEYDWISDVPADSLCDVIKRLDFSYAKFFKGAGFPKWANKRDYKSMLFKQSRNLIKLDNNKINLPKIGWLKMFKDAEIKGNIKTAIIKIEPTGFFICITTDAIKKSKAITRIKLLDWIWAYRICT